MSSGATVCDPSLTILIGAFLALSVFVGGLAAAGAVEQFRAYRARRLQKLHQSHSRGK